MATHPFFGLTSKKNEKELSTDEHILQELIDYIKEENITTKAQMEAQLKLLQRKKTAKHGMLTPKTNGKHKSPNEIASNVDSSKQSKPKETRTGKEDALYFKVDSRCMHNQWKTTPKMVHNDPKILTKPKLGDKKAKNSLKDHFELPKKPNFVCQNPYSLKIFHFVNGLSKPTTRYGRVGNIWL